MQNLFRAACLALVAFAAALPATAATVTIDDTVADDYPGASGAAINVNTTSRSEDRITEVFLVGGGLFTYASFDAAPLLSDEATAIADALAFFGLAPTTPVGGVTTGATGSTVVFTEEINVRQTSDAAILGSFESYLEVIVTAGTVEINVDQETATLTGYRLEATILPQVAAVPLPASGLLLAGGLAALGTTRRRRAA